ncbi:MAG: IS110 family transposase [Limnochordaceae bacterium]|nr:IS110 family transposase [Limnochordaceae bacterium]
MEVIHPRCAGLDVHKKSVVAHVKIPQGSEARTFGTTTDAILSLADWLAAKGVTHVAMESTGPYWKPIWNVLEGHVDVTLVNPQHIKAVPGRKTDMKDAEWICDLHRHGLLPRSYVPERPQRELRELVRYRKSLIEERTREVNRVQKTLEGANIKLGSVASNVMGVSGRAILEQLANGVDDPEELVRLAKGRLRGKMAELTEALKGLVQPHQRFMLREQLLHISDLEAVIEDVEKEIAERLAPFEAAVAKLMTIPGVGRRVAEVIVVEVGADAGHFPSDRHLASWAGLCPENRESAGKQLESRSRRGNQHLKQALVEAAWAASHTSTYLGAQFRHLSKRLKGKKALVAVAHSLVTIVYHVLKDGAEYKELGQNYFDRLDRERLERQAVRRLQSLGYEVTLTPKNSAA